MDQFVQRRANRSRRVCRPGRISAYGRPGEHAAGGCAERSAQAELGAVVLSFAGLINLVDKWGLLHYCSRFPLSSVAQLIILGSLRQTNAFQTKPRFAYWSSTKALTNAEAIDVPHGFCSPEPSPAKVVAARPPGHPKEVI